MDPGWGVVRLMDSYLSHGGTQSPTRRSRTRPNDNAHVSVCVADEVYVVFPEKL